MMVWKVYKLEIKIIIGEKQYLKNANVLLNSRMSHYHSVDPYRVWIFVYFTNIVLDRKKKS